jgi:hypothetical protein
MREAASANPGKEETRVRKQAKSQQEKPRLAWAECVPRVVCVAGTCVTLLTGPGCATPSGPEVVTFPPSLQPQRVECTKEAVKSMYDLGIGVGLKTLGRFDVEKTPSRLLVREGPGNFLVLWLDYQVGNLPQKTPAYGQIIIGKKRVYVRIHTLRTAQGELRPVCMEVWDREGGVGLIREDDGTGDTAKVFSNFDVEAVERFH